VFLEWTNTTACCCTLR